LSDEVGRIKETDVTLRDLKTELRELCELREETEHGLICNINEVGGVCDCDRAAIDNRIKQYIQANLRKVDNVRQYWRYLEDLLASAEQDYKDAGRRRAAAENTLDFLKGLCVDIMTEFGEKRLEGKHGYIRLQVNSSSPAPEIYDASLVPEKFCTYVGSFSSDVWRDLLALCKQAKVDLPSVEGVRVTREPMHSLIKAELEKKCVQCYGTAKVLDASDNQLRTVDCPKCQGTGKGVVPGVRLPARGQHARIR